MKNTKTNIKYSIKKENLENSRVKILVTVDSKDFENLFEKAKTKVLSDAKLNGFRDGKVPYEAYIKAYGEFGIRQEMGYMAVDLTYVQILIEDKIEAIGQPEVAILKVNKGEDFEYQIITDILPKVELGDYKKYSKEVKLEEITVATEDEINNALEELRRMRIKEGSAELPEVNEEFLKSVGNFKTIEELKTRIQENMDGEKKWRSEEKRKGQILDLLIADTKTEIPNSLILNELYKIEDKMKGDLAQMGVSFEDYLKHLMKTKSEWEEGEKENAKKQVIIQLALHAISKAENIKVSEETVKHEVAHIMMQYQGVDEARAKAYTEERMTNSLVAEYLFTGKVPEEKDLFGSHEGHNH